MDDESPRNQMNSPDICGTADQLAAEARAAGRPDMAVAIEDAIAGGATSSEILTRVYATCSEIARTCAEEPSLSSRSAGIAEQIRPFQEARGFRVHP